MLAYLVDDDASVFAAYQRVLSARGHQVVGTSNPAEAVAGIATVNPDVVLMDIQLGQVNGVELALRVLEERNVPIVFLTGGDDGRLAALESKDGVFAYLQKPIDGGELDATMRLVRMQHETQAKIRSTERRFRALFNQAAVGVAMIDADSGRFVEVNLRCSEILSRPKDKLIGTAMAELATTWNERAAIEQSLQQLLRGKLEHVAVEMNAQTGGGRDVRLSLDVSWLSSAPGEAREWIVILQDITEKTRADEALRRQEHLLAESQRIASIGTFTLDLATGGVHWTAETYRLFGLSPLDFAPSMGLAMAQVEVDDRPRLIEQTRNLMAGGGASSEPVQFHVRRPDGSRRLFVAHVGVVRDRADHPGYAVGTLRDITEEHLRTDRETRLLEHKEQLELVIEGTRLGFWDWNPKTGECRFNARLAEIVGNQPNEIAASLASWENQVHPDDLASYRTALHDHMEGRTNYFEATYRARHRDGHWVHILDRGRVFERDADGKPLRFCGTHTDITSEKQAQAAAIDASRAKTNFLANMSHELRTPLNAVLGLSEALLDRAFGELNELQARSLRTIHDSGGHLLALINDVLDIARVEAGKLEIERQPISVPDLIDESLALVSPQRGAKRQCLFIDVAQDIAPVEGDRRRIKQVLINLLGNAIKFSPIGATIAVHADTVVVEGVPHVELRISDNGPGIPVADRERIFEPFVTLDASLSREHQGVGLGLALVKRIVDLHGGAVRVEDHKGAGVTFVVGLRTSTVEPELPTRETVFTPRGVHIAQPVVLLAEDNEANIQMVQSYLQSVGYAVRVVRDGVAAVAAATEPDVAVILMDVQLPVLGGLEAIRRLRNNGSNLQTPIVALTAYAMPGDEARCLAAGATKYLSKPVGLRQLTETIEALVAKRSF